MRSIEGNMATSTRISKQDRTSFRWFCQAATDNQLCSIYEKERAANRKVYSGIAKEELAKRGLQI